MNDFIHIVCLDAPAPPNYGGAIDMFYKIKALSQTGWKVILHYFNYGKKRDVEELKQYCYSVHAYERKSFLNCLTSPFPYIVSSRINQKLINRLNKDEYPILLEGFHCSGIISHLKNKDRKVVIRVHNNEADYYERLAEEEKYFLRKKYFARESRLLHSYQMALDKNVTLACLSEYDVMKLATIYGFKSLHFIPCFIPWQQITGTPGAGTYCLYHGNMSVSENENAAQWLIENVFAHSQIPFLIAGSTFSKRLKRNIKNYDNITAVENPSDHQLQTLIVDAHIHVLPSFNNTGVKIKLLHAYFNGRFCITNSAGIEGSKINEGLFLANSADEYKSLINKLFEYPFTTMNIASRTAAPDTYNNKMNAQKLNALL